jgi:hypothetical protein
MAKSNLKYLWIVLLVIILVFGGFVYLGLNKYQIPQEIYVADSPELLIQSNLITYTNLVGVTSQVGCSDSAYSIGTPIWLKNYYLGPYYFDPCGKYICDGNQVKIQRKGIVSGGQISYLWYNSAEHPINTFPYPEFTATCQDGCVINGNNVECRTGLYCIANKQVCYNGEQQACSSDGMSINHVPCSYKCQNNACVVPTASMITIQNTLSSSRYTVGDYISTNVRVIFDSIPYANGKVDIELWNNGARLVQKTGVTNSEGNVGFSLITSQYVGTHTLKIKPTAYGVYREFSIDFTVNPICIPNSKTCSTSTALASCNADGSKSTLTTCTYKCVTESGIGRCVDATAGMISITPIVPSGYVVGNPLSVSVKVLFDGAVSSNTLVSGFIYKDTTQLQQVNGYTDSNGNVILSFNKLETTSYHKLKIIANSHGLSKEITQDFFVQGICTYGYSVCDSATIRKYCAEDGTRYLFETCPNQCQSGQCTVGDVVLTTTLLTEYESGSTVNFDVFLKVANVPYSQGVITAKIMKGSSLIDQISSLTDSDGKATLSFENVDALDYNNVVISSVAYEIPVSITRSVYFKGLPITSEVTTPSTIQYNQKPIEYYVHLSDKFKDIDPIYLTNVNLVNTIATGSIVSSNWTYEGNGDYKISSIVNGVGRYTGKMTFTYQGKSSETTPIIIDIRPTQIDISVKGLASSGYENEVYEGIIEFRSLGLYTDPDSITIDVSEPNKPIESTLTLDNLQKIDTGRYKFVYTFTDVEAWTLKIKADKSGYTTSSAIATVAVDSRSGGGDSGAGGAGIISIFKYGLWLIPIGIVGFIIYKVINKRRKKFKK